jgi:hypothetical protein
MDLLLPARPGTNALAILAGQLGDEVYAANLRKDAETSRGTRSASTERALLGDVLATPGTPISLP